MVAMGPCRPSRVPAIRYGDHESATALPTKLILPPVGLITCPVVDKPAGQTGNSRASIALPGACVMKKQASVTILIGQSLLEQLPVVLRSATSKTATQLSVFVALQPAMPAVTLVMGPT